VAPCLQQKIDDMVQMASASDVDEDTNHNMAIDKPGVVGLVV